MGGLRDALEHRQIWIYLVAVLGAAVAAVLLPGTTMLESGINPALALMLFVTFLQVPLAALGRAFTRLRFLAALAVANFIAVPLLVAALLPLLPDHPLVRLGVLLVLLAPCIDYVVTFSHLGQADARLLLAATPALLLLQMLLLPLYLHLMLGDAAAGLIQPGPFLHAFLWLIVLPLALAALLQYAAAHTPAGQRAITLLGLLPVPATALVLLLVVAAVLPRMGTDVLQAVPVFLAFALLAPLLGWGIGRLFRLEPAAGRAVAFSAATRNSLVVLPLAFTVPGAMPLLPAIIVTQTLVELLSQLFYIRALPKLR
ncbi:arsenic resistance protein [Roseomonas aerophila]|uniref:Arsenic resistance protein n=1 Tax=Teichococcus aerophilus TaxID=1224513 RepID=A0ABR7RQ70_9PROT|nr:arsenic resistance protein [Pseudoroseomonas aerophila]MBC9208760.1 arsenic resistance protein [Pseudoroseomonas aerophila]